MKFRSLFGKIFLWFWLANTLVISALALVVWLYPFTGLHRISLHRLHDLQLRGALAVRDASGESAFEKHLQELEKASGLRTYWLDEDGHEIRGQTLPEHILKYAEAKAPQIPAEPRAEGRGQPHPLTFFLTDAKGRPYRAIADFIGPGPSPYYQQLVSSRVFVLRVLAVVLTAGLGCYALARYLAAPVKRLQVTARQLASGNLSARVDRRLSSRGDEIGDLGRDFDRMAGQVESLLVTQRRLLQDVSHELRSPLARLNVALELAGRNAGPEAAVALDRARRDVDRLNELIRQLLELARLEGKGGYTAPTSIDLEPVLTDIIADAEFEASALDRHVRLTVCEPCKITAIAELVRWAIENVVRNAVRYTAVGSEVEVSLRRHTDGNKPLALIEVRDYGPGVPDAALTDIFRPFFRVSDARERGSGGVGLGLAITKRAVELHGGSVTASNAPGGGLLVQICIPV